MSINSSYSRLARTTNFIKNPNYPVGAMICDTPSDIGRAYQGYKRGGPLEGFEKLRKEVMSLLVWIAGIPAFEKAGSFFCEKILNIPMKIDFSKSTQGNDSILDSISYIKSGLNPKGLDVSEISHYRNNKKILAKTQEQLISSLKKAKITCALSALVLNCFAMGVALPKLNQYWTKKALEKQDAKMPSLPYVSFDEFKQMINSRQQPNNISFKGGNDLVSETVYQLNNNSRFRLMITDIPMIIGRVLTSRNQYEALETVLIDGSGMYLYNFASDHVQEQIRKRTGVPNIDSKLAEDLSQFAGKIAKFESAEELKDFVLANDEFRTKLYKTGTYGKYGKINKFVKNSELEDINDAVKRYFEYAIKKSEIDKVSLLKGDKLNNEYLKELTKSLNISNAKYLAVGTIASILGLAYFAPKLTFWITRQLTGKDQFVGITDYSKPENKKA